MMMKEGNSKKENSIFILDETFDFDLLKKYPNFNSSIIISLDFKSHIKLEKLKIEHTIGENFLNVDLRREIFNHSVSMHDWHKQINTDQFYFKNVNLLSMFDMGELQTILMHILLKFETIKKILDEFPTHTIFAEQKILDYVISINKNISVQSLNYNNTLDNLEYDNLKLDFRVRNKNFSFSLSRNRFQKLKTIQENLVCSLFNLWHKPSSKKTILFLEFDPVSYSVLWKELKKYDMDIVIFNSRKPATWNLDSIKNLRAHGIKILNSKKLINSNSTEIIREKSIKELEKIVTFLENNEKLEKIFAYQNYSIWKILKPIFIKTFQSRIFDYLYLISLSEKTFSDVNIDSIITLHQSGECEKAFLSVNKEKIPSILLEHGFMNYTVDLQDFDILSDYPNLSGKIAVWGEIQKNYLTDIRKLDSQKILVTGSPRHDTFFEKRQKSYLKKNKTILLTPRPIIEHTGNGGTPIFIKYEILLKKINETIQKIPDCELIIKLHPQQIFHNNEIRKLFEKINPNVKIYQLSQIEDILPNCDMLLNISPENLDASTTILEAMILEKPVIDIAIDKKRFEFEFLKDNAILPIDYDSNLEENFKKVLFDKKFHDELIQNANSHLDKYLAYHGDSSKCFAKILDTI